MYGGKQMNINSELKRLQLAEKALHKKIDDEVALEQEIQEVSLYTARALENRPMVPFSIQGRNFILVAAVSSSPKGKKMIQLVAREKLAVITPDATIIRADLTIDTNYTKEENLAAGIKAILGHITGCIKPEALD